MGELYSSEEVKSIAMSLGANMAHNDPVYDLTNKAWEVAERGAFFTEAMLGVPVRPEPTYLFWAYWGGKSRNTERYMTLGCRVCGYRTCPIYMYREMRPDLPGMEVLREAFDMFFARGYYPEG